MKSGVAKGAERDLSKYRLVDSYPDRKNPSYIVVSGDMDGNGRYFSFRETVDRYLDDGWRLQGGVSASDQGGDYPRVTLHQALTREAPTVPSTSAILAEDPSSETAAAAAVGGAGTGGGGGGAKAPRRASRRSNRKSATRTRKN
jgi:hypothetical protein